MTALREVLAVCLLLGGAFFMFLGSFGVLRLPDFYTRTHAATKVDTMGIMLMLGGMAVYEGFTLNALKLLLVVAFVAAVSPVAGHALARAAAHSGLRPWCPENREEPK
jgi:multicomponent Na+:H+ antiporter subunit G